MGKFSSKGRNIFVREGKLDEYDLELRATPEDLLFFVNGENSVLNLMLKNNRLGYKKLRFS